MNMKIKVFWEERNTGTYKIKQLKDLDCFWDELNKKVKGVEKR